MKSVWYSWLLRPLLWEEDRVLVKVKSWRPSWGPYGLEWPTMLVDTKGGQRMTVTPVWDSARIKKLLRM
jgi:hypothetical protein